MADEGCGYAGEGEEVFCLAFVAAVEPTAAGEPGHGPLNNPSVAAEPLRGLDPFAGYAVADAPLAEPSAQVVIVVALVGVQLCRAAATGSAGRTNRRDATHERLKALAVVHVGSRDAQRQWESVPVRDQVNFRSQLAAVGRIRSGQWPSFAARRLTESIAHRASRARRGRRVRPGRRGGALPRRGPGSTEQTVGRPSASSDRTPVGAAAKCSPRWPRR